MIINLFSIFDPSSSLFSIAWLLLLATPLVTTTKIWNISATFNKAKQKILRILNKEVSFTLKKREKRRNGMIRLAFLILLLINFLALYPQIFSPTSHLTVTLPLSLTFWLALMLFGWSKNTRHMLSHLLPQGTPNALIIFIVIIEIVRNIIRPITLCVRLTANLIAGHLLISLLGNALTQLPILNRILTLPVPIALTILERAVSFIQAYVFITLITLYTTEIK
jgi:F-type H+-transporting ATPase subunit a